MGAWTSSYLTDDPPVSDVLSNWLKANDKPGDERAALLAALNESIGEEDHDFKIGPCTRGSKTSGTTA